jgi:hypothetical protein
MQPTHGGRLLQMTTEERKEWKSAEQVESESYASLIERYGQNPEVMNALAVAWRLGFSRHLRLAGQSDSMLTVNPFWL